MNVRLMSAALLAAVVAAMPGALLAQETAFPVGGIVRSASGAPVAGASVSAGDGKPVQTGADGRFTLQLPRGRHVLRVAEPSHAAAVRDVDVGGPLSGVEIVLNPLARFAEEVVVAAVRADAEAPITKRGLDRAEIEARNTGQEMPFLLKEVPSVTQYSDSGSSTGYSYMYLRGIPQTRMNVTLDGVPLNEPEDSAFYFANFGDFANAIESLQVQRGVGTSTVGAASFVGSINFASIDLKDKAAADVRLGGGSFGTNRVSAAVHSGRLGGGIKLYGQAAYQDTEGFRRQLGDDAAQCVSRRDARYGQVVLQGLRVCGAGSIAARVPGGRRGHAEAGLALQSDEPGRTRPVRPALRHGPVPPRLRAGDGDVGAGLLQRRGGLVPDRERGGRAVSVQPRLEQRWCDGDLSRRPRRARRDVGRSRQRFRKPSRARHRRRPFRVRQPGLQERGEQLREAGLRQRPVAPLRGCAGALGAVPVRRRPRSRVGRVDVRESESRNALRRRPRRERVRLDWPRGARTRAQRHAAGRRQPDESSTTCRP